jgi:hypothetical protein
LKNVTTSCGGTAATAKQSAEPGEKGEITATFKIGDRIGTQQKAITVVTDDPAHPTATLALKVVIPQVLELHPMFVYWQAGEGAKAKTVVAKIGKDVSIKNLDVSSSNPDFTTKVESQPSANEFRINVLLRQTANAATATLTIKPNLPNGKTKIFYATASVTGPPTNTQQAATAVPSTANQPSQTVIASNAESSKGKIDACALLTSKEVQSVQNEPLNETKRSGQFQVGFAVSQCYFALPTSKQFDQPNNDTERRGSSARDPKQWWKETFHRDKDQDKGGDERKEKAAAPAKISKLGHEAFWSGNRVGGERYVLKGNSFIRISVGGAGDQGSRIEKLKVLARKVLKSL